MPRLLFPTLSALLNAVAGILIFIGWIRIKYYRDPAGHKRAMISAFVASTLFLICYVTGHLINGVTHYQKTGILRDIYFTILLTHTPLATLMVPFIIAALWAGLRGNTQLHVRITRRLLPVWLYVSITGVIIYLMLYIF